MKTLFALLALAFVILALDNNRQDTRILFLEDRIIALEVASDSRDLIREWHDDCPICTHEIPPYLKTGW